MENEAKREPHHGTIDSRHRIPADIVSARIPTADEQADTLHILCVDDDAVGLRLRAEILRRNGFKITLETDPINMMKSDILQFDLAILDFEMLGWNGLQLLQLLRNENATYPIILLSGHVSFLDDQQRSLFDCCLVKCEPVAKLLASISSLVKPKATQMLKRRRDDMESSMTANNEPN